MKAFSLFLRLNSIEEFIWGEEQQKAFDQIKEGITSLPILTFPVLSRLLKLYVSATDDSIGSLLAQDAEDGTERAVHYLRHLLNDAEARYSLIEKLCLPLFHACTKLEYYLLSREVLVMCKINIVKYLLYWLVL